MKFISCYKLTSIALTVSCCSFFRKKQKSIVFFIGLFWTLKYDSWHTVLRTKMPKIDTLDAQGDATNFDNQPTLTKMTTLTTMITETAIKI